MSADYNRPERRRLQEIAGVGMPLFWRVCLTNGVVFAIGTAVFAASPATVSSPVLVTEAIVLAGGLTLMIAANAVLLRSTLTPLDRLMRLMDRVDLLRPGQRIPETANGVVSRLVRSFNAMLARLESERGARTAQVLAAQEAERHRIAQELHDEIGQSLTAILLGLKRISDLAPPELQDELSLTQLAARSSLDEVRSVAKRLRPGVLEDLGLLSALAALTSDFTQLTGIAVKRRFDPNLPEFSKEVELVMYRIVQEGFTNVARHAQATGVILSLRRNDDLVKLCIEDNGVGLGQNREGAGMSGMRERAILINASLAFGESSRGGAKVRLILPLAAKGITR